MDFLAGEATQAMIEAAAPNWHYRHISHDILPALRERGVAEEEIHTMLVNNPRRYFTVAG
jgi:phosphotriesterase-related protein